MITIEHTVSESVFVHAQVAAELTQKIKPLSSTVRLVKDNVSVDANSILSIIGRAEIIFLSSSPATAKSRTQKRSLHSSAKSCKFSLTISLYHHTHSHECCGE